MGASLLNLFRHPSAFVHASHSLAQFGVDPENETGE